MSETASLAICQPAGDSCTRLIAYSRTAKVRIYTLWVQLITVGVMIKQITTEKWAKTKKASSLKSLRRKKKAPCRPNFPIRRLTAVISHQCAWNQWVIWRFSPEISLFLYGVTEWTCLRDAHYVGMIPSQIVTFEIPALTFPWQDQQAHDLLHTHMPTLLSGTQQWGFCPFPHH